MIIKLEDDTGEYILPELEIPLEEETIENATDVQTLDYNIYTDFISQKRQWTHEWAYMSESEFNQLKAIYDRQFTTYKYPLMTIEYYDLYNIPVRLKINAKKVIDNCGTIQGVSVTFRETAQLPDIEVS
jgi:hypothetical protein